MDSFTDCLDDSVTVRLDFTSGLKKNDFLDRPI